MPIAAPTSNHTLAADRAKHHLKPVNITNSPAGTASLLTHLIQSLNNHTMSGELQIEHRDSTLTLSEHTTPYKARPTGYHHWNYPWVSCPSRWCPGWHRDIESMFRFSPLLRTISLPRDFSWLDERKIVLQCRQVAYFWSLKVNRLRRLRPTKMRCRPTWQNPCKVWIFQWLMNKFYTEDLSQSFRLSLPRRKKQRFPIARAASWIPLDNAHL